MARRPPSENVVEPVGYEKADVQAIKALQLGTANDQQQKRALDWIIRFACQTYDLPYRPASARDTDFALGRMFVGQQIVKLINLKSERAEQQEGKRDV